MRWLDTHRRKLCDTVALIGHTHWRKKIILVKMLEEVIKNIGDGMNKGLEFLLFRSEFHISLKRLKGLFLKYLDHYFLKETHTMSVERQTLNMPFLHITQKMQYFKRCYEKHIILQYYSIAILNHKTKYRVSHPSPTLKV